MDQWTGALAEVGRVISADFWRGRRVFVTGHTGFKGSWLWVWLDALGAELTGYALAPPTTPSLYAEADLERLGRSIIADVRDTAAVADAMHASDPEVVLHLAAQPLVRTSYADPVGTYATNVMGTVNVLEAARTSPSVRAVVNVTTDKCYENQEWPWGYRENEPMGGHDPYSSSKGCSELVTSAYRRSFFAGGAALGSARAGNVIGGGDWAVDRLVPDTLAAFAAGDPVVLRNPNSTRPWQHVLEPLSGYLLLAERLFADGQAVAEGWNFGPDDIDARPVDWVVSQLARTWGPGADWRVDDGPHPHEAGFLKLDTSKARAQLGWAPRWHLARALEETVAWHRSWSDGEDPLTLCRDQINTYTTTSLEEGNTREHA